MTTTETRPARPALARLARPAVLVLAVGQVVSTALSGLLAPQSLSSGPDVSPIVPPGPMFAIWGVIITAALVWAILQIRPSVRPDPTRDALAPSLALVFAGFAAWLAVAAQSQSTPATLVVFAVMLAGLLVALQRARAERQRISAWPRRDRWTLWFLLGTYTGWSAVAFFVNVATVLQAAGAPAVGAWGSVWQSLLLLAVTGLAVLVVRRGVALVSFAATVAYALIGVVISTATTGFAVLAGVAVAGLIAVVVTTIVTRAAGVSRPDPAAGLT